MLGFFQRIRKRLLDSGSLSKYMAYAIGEIALVVIGILIALQINTWNQKASDRALEEEYLQSLKKDLIADTISLRLILEQVELNLSSAVTLIHLFTQPQSGPLDTAKIYESIRLAGFLMHFEPNSATFDDLKSTGNIRVLSNLELKKAIGSYYTFIEARKNYRNLWQDKVWGDYWDARDKLINDELDAFWTNSYRQNIVSVDLPRNFELSRREAKKYIQSLYDIVDMSTFRKTVFTDILSRARGLIQEVGEDIEK